MPHKPWPSFETKDLLDLDTDESLEEMQRRWETHDREMKALIAAGGVHQDSDGWWVDDESGELIGRDPSIEKPLTEEDLKNARPFSEAFPELHASIQRNKARSPQKRRS